MMRSKFGFGSRDVEKAPQVDNASDEIHSNETRDHEHENYNDNVSDGAVPGESFEYGNSLYAKIQRIAGKLNVEQRGIERVPENERTDTSYFNIGSMVRSPLLAFLFSTFFFSFELTLTPTSV